MRRRKRERRDKEKERYYLLPGQGGRAYRRKQKLIVIWSIIAAVLVSLIITGAMYLINRSSRF